MLNTRTKRSIGLEQGKEGGKHSHEAEGVEVSTQGPVTHIKEFCLYPKHTGSHSKILSNSGGIG